MVAVVQNLWCTILPSGTTWSVLPKNSEMYAQKRLWKNALGLGAENDPRTPFIPCGAARRAC